MVITDSFRRLILPGFFRIGVNSRRHFCRRFVITLKVSYRTMAQTALKGYLMLVPYDLISTEE